MGSCRSASYALPRLYRVSVRSHSNDTISDKVLRRLRPGLRRHNVSLSHMQLEDVSFVLSAAREFNVPRRIG